MSIGMKVVKVISLVDREEGGRENIEALGYDFEAIFTKSELIEERLKFDKPL